jgi:hypothetical protein
VAVGTQEVLLLPIPVAGSSAMNACSPIPQLEPMTLAAEFVGFSEIDQFAAGRVQHISIIGIVTIHAPPVFFIVFKDDIFVEFFQLSSLEVDFHVGMTSRTGENILAEGGRRDLDIHLLFRGGLLSFFSRAGHLIAHHKHEEKEQPYKYRRDETMFEPESSHFKIRINSYRFSRFSKFYYKQLFPTNVNL